MTFEDIVAGVNEAQVGIAVRTAPCPHCHTSAEVLLAEDEYAWLADGRSVNEALSSRDAAFRELFITGIHEHCWDPYLNGDELNGDVHG